jgi:hypothetical protein
MTMQSGNANVTPERINALAEQMREKMRASLKEIDDINMQVRLLSFNAQVEAARAGASGQAFGVVASYMGELATRTSDVAENLATQVQAEIDEMAVISRQLATDVRGARLADLALNNIDLIDRNLYERTCDVRWWATDASLTQACADPDHAEVVRHASKRLGVILDAYTVYFDLVLCLPDGRVIANGRPRQFQSVGSNVSKQEWFQSAMATSSGDEFGFQTVHKTALVGNERILAYSCTVREDGEADGAVLGVLGILFRWDALAQTVVEQTSVPAWEKELTRALVVDREGAILADTEGRMLLDRLSFEGMSNRFEEAKGFVVAEFDRARAVIAYARAPGFETYSTGWYSVVIQRLQ